MDGEGLARYCTRGDVESKTRSVGKRVSCHVGLILRDDFKMAMN